MTGCEPSPAARAAAEAYWPYVRKETFTLEEAAMWERVARAVIRVHELEPSRAERGLPG